MDKEDNSPGPDLSPDPDPAREASDARKRRYADMAKPEWISSTLTKAIQLTDEGPRVVQIKTGVIRLPGSGGRRIASQAEGRDVFIIPPSDAAKVMGAIREGLLTAS